LFSGLFDVGGRGLPKMGKAIYAHGCDGSIATRKGNVADEEKTFDYFDFG